MIIFRSLFKKRIASFFEPP